MGSQKQQCQHVPVPTTDYSVVITTLFHKPIPISAFIVNSTSQRQTDKYTGYAYTWQNTYNHFCVSSYYKRCYKVHICNDDKHTHTDSQSKNTLSKLVTIGKLCHILRRYYKRHKCIYGTTIHFISSVGGHTYWINTDRNTVNTPKPRESNIVRKCDIWMRLLWVSWHMKLKGHTMIESPWTRDCNWPFPLIVGHALTYASIGAKLYPLLYKYN